MKEYNYPMKDAWGGALEPYNYHTIALWFAERLSRPVGRFAGAADKVGSGDLEIQVPEESGDDEIALLGRAFNKMIKKVKNQRDILLTNNSEIDKRKRLFETVIGNVTGGIVGLDPSGRIEVINPAAQKILQLKIKENISLNYFHIYQ